MRRCDEGKGVFIIEWSGIRSYDVIQGYEMVLVMTCYGIDVVLDIVLDILWGMGLEKTSHRIAA